MPPTIPAPRSRRFAERRFRAPIAAVLLSVLGASGLGAQGVFERMNLDRLQIVSLGASSGAIRPSQVEATNVYAVGADYGALSPGWRLQFAVQFWTSQLTDHVVQTFVDTLTSSLDDPGGTATIRPSRISIYDVAFGVGARRVLSPRSGISPYFTLGIAAHVIDAEGKLIEGTFVERAVDDIGTGLYAAAGGQIRILRRILIEAEVRGDLLSGYRSTQARAGASYYFGERRRGTNE